MEGIPLRNPGWPRPGTHFIVKILRLQAEDVPELVQCVVSERQSSRKQRSEKNFGGSEEKGVMRKATDVR